MAGTWWATISFLWGVKEHGFRPFAQDRTFAEKLVSLGLMVLNIVFWPIMIPFAIWKWGIDEVRRVFLFAIGGNDGS